MPNGARETDRKTPRPVLLVVDDEESVRNFLQVCLTRLGYNVLAAGSGEEALLAISQCQNDGADLGILITDVNMPGMNGIELAAQFASRHPELPILFISGKADLLELGQSTSTSDGVWVLQKPFGLAQLQQAVATALQGGHYGDGSKGTTQRGAGG
jgi:CheY-like chemotaxis protein